MNLLKSITPTNLNSEREKFLDSNTYNPIFNYVWQTDKIHNLDESSLRGQLINSVINQEVDEIVNLASKLFEVNLRWEYKSLAEDITSNHPGTNVDYSIHEFEIAFDQAFKYFGLVDYRLEVVDKHGFNFRPSAKNKKIMMSKYADFQYLDIEGDVKHELSHIIRYENGKYNQIKRSSDYLPTEEGLATFVQDRSTNGKRSLFQHAAEYVASEIGIDSSLRDIYEYFLELGFNSELAWQRASRHKFGFIDTSIPGDILKPAMYFDSQQKVSNLDLDDQVKLYVGKVSINDLDSIESYRGMFKEELIRDFFFIN